MKPEALRHRERTAPEAVAYPYAGKQAWRIPIMVFAVGTLAFAALFWESAARAVQTWQDSTAYNHGFLIIPICLYLAWLRRDLLRNLIPAANYWGLVALGGAGFGWLFGNVMGVLVIQQFALVAMVQALFFTILGSRVTRVFLFPLFYLFFAVPLGEFMVEPLQNFTAVFAVRGLQLIGVPVFLDGIFISIPNCNFEVAEACAGVRFLIATVALGFLGANMFYRAWWRRGLFVGLALGVPIVANGFRAFGIVYIGYISDSEVAAGVDHIVYGWIFFAFVTAVLLAFGASFRDKVTLMPARHSAELTHFPPVLAETSKSFAVAGLAAVLIAAAAPAYVALADSRLHQRKVIAVPALEAGSGWQRIEGMKATWYPHFAGADAELISSYRFDDRTVDLYTAFYTYQREGAEIVNQMNGFGDDKIWTKVGSGRIRAILDGRPKATAYARLLSRSQGRLVWYWFWVDGEFTASPLIAKLLQARARLTGGNEAAAVIAVAANYEETPADAAAVLRSFMQSMAPFGQMLENIAETTRG